MSTGIQQLRLVSTPQKQLHKSIPPSVHQYHDHRNDKSMSRLTNRSRAAFCSNRTSAGDNTGTRNRRNKQKMDVLRFFKASQHHGFKGRGVHRGLPLNIFHSLLVAQCTTHTFLQPAYSPFPVARKPVHSLLTASVLHKPFQSVDSFCTRQTFSQTVDSPSTIQTLPPLLKPFHDYSNPSTI